MKPLAPLVAAAALLLAAPAAQSAAFHFTGSIDHHNDIVTIPFTLDEDADIFQLWTDSWLDGLNFDPIAALWAD
ncbi:MAG: DVUA0089 family protein, partial [Azoarcus sp.]|nr:DVUA0089 family protein [Azoarcus sp.]